MARWLDWLKLLYEAVSIIPLPRLRPIERLAHKAYGLSTAALRGRCFLTLSLRAKVFNFKEGTVLHPFNGLNEFLSTVAAARILKECIQFTLWDKIQFTTCIESTIPFRAANEQGETPFDILFQRTQQLINDFTLQVPNDKIETNIKRAVAFSNQDVSGFFNEDFGLFISQTWTLILENNPIFRNSLFTVGQYRLAIQRVKLFLSTLKYQNVVHSWNDFPRESDLEAMHQQIQINLRNAVEYINIKLVSIAILETFAQLSGGDAPYLFFLGEEVSIPQVNSVPIEEFLKAPPSRLRTAKKEKPTNLIVFETLKYGRSQASGFDFKNSPIAGFLYQYLTHGEMDNLLALSAKLYDGQLDRLDFVRAVPLDILEPILIGIGTLTGSRMEMSVNLLEGLKNNNK